jgi:hypothetical protein
LKEINKAVFTVTSCGSFQCDVNDFSADTLQIYAVSPEPSTMALSGLLLAVGVAMRKRFLKGVK